MRGPWRCREDSHVWFLLAAVSMSALRALLRFVLLLGLLVPATAESAAMTTPRSTVSQRAAQEVPRDARGRIKRSAKAKRDFQRGQPCPSSGQSKGPCPGYQIDHTVPLACGGPDTPVNMQWLSLTEKRAKDRIERKDC